jgi:hypothetical protein
MHRMPRRLVAAMVGVLLPLALGGQAFAATQGSPVAGVLSVADVTRLSADATQRSIIVLRNQHRETPARAGTADARAGAVESDQRAIKGELATLHSTARSLHTVNAIAATISKAEAGRLAANPAVQAVVPDRVVPHPQLEPQTIGSAASPAAAPAAAELQQLCPSNPAVPQLEPEALQVTNAEHQPGSGLPAAHDLADGTGVKVAFIADGLDINNPDLSRNGQSIFFDYQDFSGDGLNARTPGGEAFGDAASIAAQGNQVYDLSQFVNPSHPLPPGCNIRIKGMAPGVTLAGLKVFGTGGAFNSTIIQAVDWAIERDHVDVINESFGGNPFPDDQADPVQIANENAVAAGITVVASSGDAGFTSTIGNTAATSGVISAAGSTTLRLYRQQGSYGSQLSSGGWIDNNPSALSSSGFVQITPRTVDVMAPGDLGWALCSTNVAIYFDCFDNSGRPAAIEIFGGTSESSPLIAGEAALVIDGYRRAHGGASPGAALVKRIIMSTATDLGIPAQQQGAGLIDALRAVREAMSISDANGSPSAQGDGLLLSQTSLSSTAATGAARTFHVTVTNTGATPQRVAASVRHLAADPLSNDSGALTLASATAPTFIDALGRPSAYVLHTFDVPEGAQRLNAEITWAAQAQPGTTVRETLFDPFGRMAMYSLPQGAASGFAHVDVHDPAPGTWTAVIWNLKTGTQYNGSVNFAFWTQRFESFGSVSPANRTLQPGQTAAFTVHMTTPTQAGDVDGSLVLDSGTARASAPIVLRSLVPTSATGGSFSGAIQGGNGRSANNSQQVSFQFDVPRNEPALNLALTLQDPNYRVLGFLVDPSGEPLDIQSDAVLSPTGALLSLGTQMQFFMRDPRAGRWTLVIRLSRSIDGARFLEPFSGRITFDQAQVVATGVPNSSKTTLAAGQPVTATLQVTNTGSQSESFFVDARLNQVGSLPLLGSGATGFALPLVTTPAFLVPPGTDRLTVVAQSTVPIVMDIQPSFGQPTPLGTTLANNFSVAEGVAPQVAPGFWFAIPEELGPFDPVAGAPHVTANAAALAETQLFDPAVTSSSGDLWLQSVDATAPYTPLVLAPGATGTITVVITPGAASGTVVKGTLQVDTFTPFTNSGDQVISIPYSYRVG